MGASLVIFYYYIDLYPPPPTHTQLPLAKLAKQILAKEAEATSAKTIQDLKDISTRLGNQVRNCVCVGGGGEGRACSARVPFPRALTRFHFFSPAPLFSHALDPLPCVSPCPLSALVCVCGCVSVSVCVYVCVFCVFCVSVSASVWVRQLEDMHKVAESASRQLSYHQGVPGGGST